MMIIMIIMYRRGDRRLETQWGLQFNRRGAYYPTLAKFLSEVRNRSEMRTARGTVTTRRNKRPPGTASFTNSSLFLDFC
jgi:hypothetical protein